MFFWKKKPYCPVCHRYMVETDVEGVPPDARREFARLNRWQPLSLRGWCRCQYCTFFVHQPTLDKGKF